VVSSTDTNLVFNPKLSVATQYTVRAYSTLLTNCDDTVTANVYRVEIVPSETNICWKTNYAEFKLTPESYGGSGGFSWTNTPVGLSNVVVSGDGRTFSFNPRESVPGAYELKAWPNNLPTCFGIATAKVIHIEITPPVTNVCGKSAVPVTLNLTPESYWNSLPVTWGGTNGLGISGSGDNFLTFVPSNSTPTSYVVTAWAGTLTNCAAAATVKVYRVDITPSETNICWKTNYAEFKLTPESYGAAGGFSWTNAPVGLSNVVVSGDGRTFSFNPRESVPGAYELKAWPNDLPTCFGTATAKVIHIEITPPVTNVCGKSAVPVTLNLTPEATGTACLSHGAARMVLVFQVQAITS